VRGLLSVVPGFGIMTRRAIPACQDPSMNSVDSFLIRSRFISFKVEESPPSVFAPLTLITSA